MKRITIIGDSYSCGEWMSKTTLGYDTNSLFRKEVDNYACIVETHPGIELYLNEMGHACCTLGIGGSSNLAQLNILEESLMLRMPRSFARFCSPHVIVWFITEPLRDLANAMNNFEFIKPHREEILREMNAATSLGELNMKILDISFRQAQSIFDRVNIPFILVQGLSGSYNLEKNYDFCIHNFDTWIDDMVGMRAPMISSTQNISVIRNKVVSLFGHTEMDSVIDEIHAWRSATEKCEYMPDGGHPDRRKHFELAVEIDKIISR